MGQSKQNIRKTSWVPSEISRNLSKTMVSRCAR